MDRFLLLHIKSSRLRATVLTVLSFRKIGETQATEKLKRRCEGTDLYMFSLFCLTEKEKENAHKTLKNTNKTRITQQDTTTPKGQTQTHKQTQKNEEENKRETT